MTRKLELVLATQWSVVDGYAAEVVLSFLERLLQQGQPPTEALRQAQRQVRLLSVDDLLHRWEKVEQDLGEDTPDQAKFFAQKAWLGQQAGRPDEARRYAEQAVTGLRRIGMDDDADRLLAFTRAGAIATARPVNLQSFDLPVFWSAFQLVGRVV
jgi:CHAT domain-containing protein